MATHHFSAVPVWGSVGRMVRFGARANTTISVTLPDGTDATVVQNGATQVGYLLVNSEGLVDDWTTTDVPTVVLRFDFGSVTVSSAESATAGATNAAAAQAAQALAEDARDDAQAAAASSANKVDKGSLVYNAADYASLSAAITAVPDGGTIRLAAGTTYSANALTGLTKNLTIEGHDPRSSIIDGASNAYAFTTPSTGTAVRLTFRNVGFTGSTSGQVRLTANRHASARFVDCRFSGFSQFAIENSGVDLLCVRCDFEGNGTPGSTNAIFHQYGAPRITLRDCTFRYLNRGLYCADTNGPAGDVSISGCTFDGGWMYLKTSGGTGSGGTVTYSSTTVTDTGASFAALTANTTVRALASKQTGTITAVAGGRTTDSAANFTTAAVKRGDIIRTATKWGVVDEVVSSTILKVEQWIDSTTYADVDPPATSTAYTVYGLVIGRVASNTSTVLTVDAWRDWDGTIATPASGTLYEVVPKTDYQCFVLRANHVTITGNTFRRGWSDQIAPLNSRHVVVANNNIYDGQDVGITIQGSTTFGQTALVTGNRISHHGTAGIWCNAPDTVISSNSILDANWMSLSTSTYAAIMLETGADRTLVANNEVKRVNNPNALKAFHCNGTTSGIEFRNNKTSGYTTHLVITGTNVTNVWGSFEPDTVVSLQSSAVGPRGEFSGSGVPAIPASAGSTYRRTDGGAGTSFYVKETASSSTTWAAK